MDYEEFDEYLQKYHKSVNFHSDILQQIQKITADCFRATCHKIDPNRRINTFELYGLDFMPDDQYKLYLIEVNTTPALETTNPVT